MNLARIQQMADDELPTQYEGDRSSGGYTGFGDDLVDFGGDNVDFSTELATARRFTIAFTNTIQAEKIALLCPSYMPTFPAGNANGAPIQDIADGAMITVGGTNLSATGSPKTIKNLLSFIERNPTRLIAMKIVSNQTDQLAKQLTIKRQSPFRSLEDEYLDLASYTVETSNNDKMVTVRGLNLQFDNQTEIQMPIVACDGVTTVKTTVTLYFGAVLNTASALNKKGNKAGNHPRVAQARAVVAGA